MARQKGILPIQGTIGNITFFKSKDGYLVKEKSSVTANQIANDPAFQRTRENNAEFGRAANASKQLRDAFRSMLQNASDSRMVSRLTAECKKVINADMTSARGMRNVIDGEALLLEKFEFNIQGKLSTTLYCDYTCTIDRATGIAEIVIAPFVPTEKLHVVAGTTHFSIVGGAGVIDFEAQKAVAAFDQQNFLNYNTTPTTAITLHAELTPNSTHPIFLLVSVQFFQEINGTKYPLKNGSFNACSIVKVDA